MVQASLQEEGQGEYLLAAWISGEPATMPDGEVGGGGAQPFVLGFDVFPSQEMVWAHVVKQSFSHEIRYLNPWNSGPRLLQFQHIFFENGPCS